MLDRVLLRHAGEDMFDALARAGDAPVAPPLCFGDRLVLATLALKVHAVVLGQALFALAIDVACSFAGQVDPLRLHLSPCPCECCDPVLRPLEWPPYSTPKI